MVSPLGRVTILDKSPGTFLLLPDHPAGVREARDKRFLMGEVPLQLNAPFWSSAVERERNNLKDVTDFHQQNG